MSLSWEAAKTPNTTSLMFESVIEDALQRLFGASSNRVINLSGGSLGSWIDEERS